MKAKYPELKGSIRIENFYVILNMCYHLGVFFSRSSLSVIRIKRVWVLSGFQILNFVFLLFNSKLLMIESLLILCPLFVWVGLNGGGAYVNVLHMMLQKEDLAKDEKEMAVNLSLMFNDSGILIASIASLLLDNYYFDFNVKK